ncbi:hypothetical protein NPIL_513291 [Nephila pilipes]|uniref:Uncharacterized protein n=1 Tax=Nephila pilipes TaxID=299642 RepID=A0A8X6TFG8_NEPPI|nr:hypothetical protein NPIL_513291 [Nephila pilipes]
MSYSSVPDPLFFANPLPASVIEELYIHEVTLSRDPPPPLFIYTAVIFPPLHLHSLRSECVIFVSFTMRRLYTNFRPPPLLSSQRQSSHCCHSSLMAEEKNFLSPLDVLSVVYSEHYLQL